MNDRCEGKYCRATPTVDVIINGKVQSYCDKHFIEREEQLEREATERIFDKGLIDPDDRKIISWF